MHAITDHLLVGSLDDAADHDAFAEHDVTAVCKLTHGDPDRPYPADVTVFEHPMLDGPRHDPETFRAAVESVSSTFDDGETVLVHCSAGSSRSVSVAAAALAVTSERSVTEAFELVEERNPDFGPHPALVRRAVHVASRLTGESGTGE